MQLAVSIGTIRADNIADTAEFICHAEKLGVDYAWSHEAWGSDAVSPLAFLAAKTSRIKLGCGVIQISSRVPAMVAMTALTLDALSSGRFILGLGASGPQVVEGLHGVAYERPLSRLRESVDIVRLGLAGKKITYQGRGHELPLAGGEGKALRLEFEPRPALPIYLATLGPRALEYTGRIADGWLGTSFSPEHAEAHITHLRRGAVAAGRCLTDIDLQVACYVAIGENVELLIGRRKAAVAFALGAMGSASTNFYNEAFQRAGYTDDAKAVQSLWLAGKREAAAARVPDELVTLFSAIGTPTMVRERFIAFKRAGINCLYLRFDGASHAERMGLLSQVCDIVATLS